MYEPDEFCTARELGLTPREERALDDLMESVVRTLQRRFPPALELTGIRLEFDRRSALASAAPEELH